MKDGIWLEWEDVKEECQTTGEVESVPCGPGHRLQKRICERSLGGKYCSDNGKEVIRDVLYRTTKCSVGECPG